MVPAVLGVVQGVVGVVDVEQGVVGVVPAEVHWPGTVRGPLLECSPSQQ